MVACLKDHKTTVDHFYEIMTEKFFIDPFEHVQVLHPMTAASKTSAVITDSKDDDLALEKPEHHLWNLFLFAVYYDRADVVERLLSEEFEDFITVAAILQPPLSNDANHVFSNENNPSNNQCFEDGNQNFLNLKEQPSRSLVTCDLVLPQR